jgi:hypothetical protein
MSEAAAAVEIPQEARDKAKELGWEPGLIEMALQQGHSLQEVWQALRANVDGATAKNFLAGESFIKPDLNWMNVPTEWGMRARPRDPAMGLTIQDLMIGTYGDVPDVWTNRSEIARGSYPNAVVEDMGYTIFEKGLVWADNCVPLYERAIKDRWASATDLNWNSLEPLPDDTERAMCQLLTELSDRAYFQSSVIAGWLPEISYGFLETKLFLSTVIYDLARHAESFRKRALSNGGGLGLQAPTDYSRAVQEARSYPELMALLFVQDSMLLTLYEHGDELAQNELERTLFALCARDRRRVVEYQVERLKHYLFKYPERRDEHNLYFLKAESRMAKDWMDTVVRGPLLVLLGGGKGGAAQGAERLEALRRAQIVEYVANLKRATFDRERLHPRLRELVEAAASPA